MAASLGAGLVTAWIAWRNPRTILALAGILLVLFVPVHYGLWDKFPVWYHTVFLVSLLLAPPLGGRLAQRSAKR